MITTHKLYLHPALVKEIHFKNVIEITARVYLENAVPCDQTLTEGFPPGASGPSEGGAGRTLLPQVGLLRGIPHVGPPQSRSLYWPTAGSWLETRTKSAQKPGATPGAASGAWPNPTAPLQELLWSGGCRKGRGRRAEEGGRPECGRYAKAGVLNLAAVSQD
ncbi:unnamed protein product [Rangifer tarandus platyrhynchus]|uniref:Uncharacterized protein n=2 Tax=Rangifer tarandus platyrhynchus TaxID=3082113 RepID=A0ACB0ERJ7_RANTA|nr:unnamed protein product [Rangifer tarandus platyrhynchus]CAI9703382.1 unnamed protein product [Rangifer tarandus platyrhynchus]